MSILPNPPKDIGSAVAEGTESKEFSRSKEMTNLPPLNDHAFWRLLRVQCNCDKPMSQIASELGVDVDDLCAWIMDYKAPKNKPYINRQSPPLAHSHVDKDRYSAPQAAQRFANWRKAREGAAQTRRMLEVAEL